MTIEQKAQITKAGKKVDRYMRLFGGQNGWTISRSQAKENYKRACNKWISPIVKRLK
jgi:hypothetical protein